MLCKTASLAAAPAAAAASYSELRASTRVQKRVWGSETQEMRAGGSYMNLYLTLEVEPHGIALNDRFWELTF